MTITITMAWEIKESVIFMMKTSKKQENQVHPQLKVNFQLTKFYLESDDEKAGFDSDAMLDEPEECDILGIKTDCYHEKDSVTKEIITVRSKLIQLCFE